MEYTKNKINSILPTRDPVADAGGGEMPAVECEDVEGVRLLVVPREDDVPPPRHRHQLHREAQVVRRRPQRPHVLPTNHRLVLCPRDQ